MVEIERDTSVSSRQAYSSDWFGKAEKTANAVCFPTSAPEVEQCFSDAQENNEKIVVRGGNTGLSGGTLVEDDKSVVISTNKMRDVLEYDLDTQIVTASAGYTLHEVNEYLASFNMFLPLHMGSYQSAQVGGIVATNAGGMHAWKYGMARNLITNIECVSPSRGILDMRTASLKNNEGANPVEHFIGSDGRLGVITKVSFRAFPIKASSLGLLLIADRFAELSDMSRTIEEKFFEYLDVAEFISGRSPGAASVSGQFTREKMGLILTFASSMDQAKFETLFLSILSDDDILSNDGRISFLTASQVSKVIAAREALPSHIADFGSLLKFDLRLKVSCLDEFHTFVVKQIASYSGALMSFFGHFKDGNVHLNLAGIDPTEAGDLISCLNDEVLRHGGGLSAEHGLGLSKRRLIASYLSEGQLGLDSYLRDYFDGDRLLSLGH